MTSLHRAVSGPMRLLLCGLNETWNGGGIFDFGAPAAIQSADLPREQRGRCGRLNVHERLKTHAALRVSRLGG